MINLAIGDSQGLSHNQKGHYLLEKILHKEVMVWKRYLLLVAKRLWMISALPVQDVWLVLIEEKGSSAIMARMHKLWACFIVETVQALP
jgi:hypothetical protein